ncbi:CFI-box-CTERM domain-containing protein [Haloplanus ruber]|uniref:CFI-box-CTERM domain-containing protein n=1 Tax=Haloplanus ruber TaxID=869892 RepID=A0ABD6CZJ8_9EURY|nr:CFI-box-CTERM domain-containing protein [Haloplanus ruber]
MSTDDGADTPAEGSDDLSESGVGDGREKHVRVVTAAGKEFDHDKVFLRHTETEYLICADPDFPPAETTRYRKDDLHRAEITQHHSNCFITTATAGEGPTLESLRGFRADVMAPTRSGRALLRVYETVSPPIAATLARHPDAGPTRAVRRLVDTCGSLADRRDRTGSVGQAALSVVLIALYVVGVVTAAAGHVWLRGREASSPN